MLEGMDAAQVEAFIAEFEAGRLPGARWTHEAHLIAGFWYAWQLPMPAALDAIRPRIRAHNEAVGTGNTDSTGYHESITRLYMTMICQHIAAHGAHGFEAALRGLLESPAAARDWPLTLYSRTRLFSPEARRSWMAPDLAPDPSPTP